MQLLQKHTVAHNAMVTGLHARYAAFHAYSSARTRATSVAAAPAATKASALERKLLRVSQENDDGMPVAAAAAPVARNRRLRGQERAEGGKIFERWM